MIGNHEKFIHNMRKIHRPVLLLLAVISFIQVSAQQKNIVRGRIIDRSENETVIGANIIEYDEEDRVINGTISDVNGNFVLEMKNPENKVRISMIGYETKEIIPDFNNPMTIELQTSKMELEEVTVTAQIGRAHV